jgi:ketosteroid isomerase-like protein
MVITPDTVREIFKGLESGDGAAFFPHVAEEVDWTVMGTHPLAGHYLSKEAFIEGTFAKLVSRNASAPGIIDKAVEVNSLYFRNPQPFRIRAMVTFTRSG